jgi:hypothetical protein
MYSIEHSSSEKKPDIEIRIFYRGMKVSNDFLDKNQTIKQLYPSNEIFAQSYSQLKSHTLSGKKSILEISENGISEYPNVLL